MTRTRALRLLLGFLAGLLVWLALSGPYERALARGAEATLRLFEWPSVTRLTATDAGIVVARRDFPPASPRPVLPAKDLHFNFVLLITLFVFDPPAAASARFARLLILLFLLFLIHVLALVFQVQSVYATALGPWSAAHYGKVARNIWAGGFHFYQVAGRFAAPFALWWVLGRREEEEKPSPPGADQKRRPGRRRRKG